MRSRHIELWFTWFPDVTLVKSKSHVACRGVAQTGGTGPLLPRICPPSIYESDIEYRRIEMSNCLLASYHID